MGGWVVHGVVASAFVVGCGRIGFAPVDNTSGDANGSNQGVPDAPLGDMVVIPAAADTAINSFAPTLNYGAGTTFNVRSDTVSTYTGLIAFDLTGQTGMVTSVTLRITTSAMALSAGSIRLMRVLEAWDEGDQTGGAGAANHNQRQAGTAWTSAGCGPGSREVSAIGELQPLEINTQYEVTLASPVVQAWLDDPASNHGVTLVAAGTGNDTVAFFARESAMAPELVVYLLR